MTDLKDKLTMSDDWKPTPDQERFEAFMEALDAILGPYHPVSEVELYGRAREALRAYIKGVISDV